MYKLYIVRIFYKLVKKIEKMEKTILYSKKASSINFNIKKY